MSWAATCSAESCSWGIFCSTADGQMWEAALSRRGALLITGVAITTPACSSVATSVDVWFQSRLSCGAQLQTQAFGQPRRNVAGRDDLDSNRIDQRSWDGTSGIHSVPGAPCTA